MESLREADEVQIQLIINDLSYLAVKSVLIEVDVRN